MAKEKIDAPLLELESVIGFNGAVPGGLKVHPNRQNLIYPLGCTVVIEDITAPHKQSFLWGHSNNVSCVAVSKSGKYVASGQYTHMGFKADAIIWDFETRSLLQKLQLHMNKVEALAFSPNDKYLVTLGGQDDGCVVVWNLENGDAICGHDAQVESAGNTYCVAYSNVDDNLFVTGGDNTLRIWTLDRANRKIKATDVIMGQISRVVNCIEMADDWPKCEGDDKSKFFFCGTTTGDIIGVNISSNRFQFLGPEKKDDKFKRGVKSMTLVKSGELLVGAGDGEVAKVVFRIKEESNKKSTYKMQKLKSWIDQDDSGTKFKTKAGGVTSIALRGDGHQFFVGTENSQIYCFNFPQFTCELSKTCHSSEVNDIIFPFGNSDLIVTCQKEDIRVWALSKKRELTRLRVCNMTCNAVDITRDGSIIVSAWDDGTIRGYGFQASKDKREKFVLAKKFKIDQAHGKGVTAVAVTTDSNRSGLTIISGGGEGQVRVWRVTQNSDGSLTDTLVANMKEHKGSVSDIKVKKNGLECVSASTDGTAIIWDLKTYSRSQIVFANTLFKCVAYGVDECQIITSGTDRKIGYWESWDGQPIRELEGSKTGAIHALDMSPDNQHFVSGGDDKLLKLFSYEQGELCYVGIGHSGSIKKCKISPDHRCVVSVSDDGAILIWKFPFTPSMQQRY